VREDDNNKPLGEGVVTGGMQMTPFSGSLVFSKASAKYGAVVLYTVSAKPRSTDRRPGSAAIRVVGVVKGRPALD